MFAYRPQSGRPLRNGDIIGAPDWTDSEHFDIEAKGDAIPSPEQMRVMVQSLMLDRFQLKAHWETREMPTFNLVLAKNGPKFKPSQDQSPVRIDAQGRGTVRTLGKPSPAGIALSMSGNALPMDTLVSNFQSYAGRPVFDKTGLSGLFDVSLEFFLDSNNVPPAAAPSGPPFAIAIEEQLGLKLESATGPVEVLGIDSVSKPSEN
jgi:uncharacterized protein (TIGR03435 family)